MNEPAGFLQVFPKPPRPSSSRSSPLPGRSFFARQLQRQHVFLAHQFNHRRDLTDYCRFLCLESDREADPDREKPPLRSPSKATTSTSTPSPSPASSTPSTQPRIRTNRSTGALQTKPQSFPPLPPTKPLLQEAREYYTEFQSLHSALFSASKETSHSDDEADHSTKQTRLHREKLTRDRIKSAPVVADRWTRAVSPLDSTSEAASKSITGSKSGSASDLDHTSESEHEGDVQNHDAIRKDAKNEFVGLARLAEGQENSDGSNAGKGLKAGPSDVRADGCDDVPSNIWAMQLSRPELLSELPPDFSENWFVVPVPISQRCLVISCNGKTVARTIDGSVFCVFDSNMPDGNPRLKRNGEHCIVDCLYSTHRKTFYLLDVLCWKGVSYYNTEASFRFFWMREKVMEAEIFRISHYNSIPFQLIDMYPATADHVSEALDTCPQGLLFYHKDAHHVFGQSPLTCFLDVSEMSVFFHTKFISA